MHERMITLCNRAALVAFSSLLLAACSERESNAVTSATRTAVARIEPSFETKSLQKVAGQVAAGGIATKYDAYFDQQQLKGIIEERQGHTAVEQGEYVFMGARLLQYTGAALTAGANHAGENIELKFDVQGRLESARALQDEPRTLEQTQIDAIRARAELLRSHALMQRSVNAHRREGAGG